MVNVKRTSYEPEAARAAGGSPHPVASPDVQAWRPLAAGAVILIGGLGALLYGVLRGELVYVLGTLGVTLLVAGLVDGTGPRYRGSGLALLGVFISAKVLNHLPGAFQRGVAYGALMAAFGVYVIVRQWPKYRASAAGDTPSVRA